MTVPSSGGSGRHPAVERSLPSELFRYNGREATGLSVGMREGANILTLGKDLAGVIERAQAWLPIGIDIAQVADQPHVVDEAVGHFLQALAEAVVIVLAVSFMSLGLRAGLVVAVAIPLMLAINFVMTSELGFTLQPTFARGADYCSGAVGGRCDDRHRDDDLAPGKGRVAGARGELCLDLHRIPDADGHVGDRGGVRSHRAERQRGGEIHLFAVRGGRSIAAVQLGGGGVVRAAFESDLPAAERVHRRNVRADAAVRAGAGRRRACGAVVNLCGAPGFLLSYDVPTRAENMGQIVIQTPSVEARNGLRVDRKALPRRGFPGADIFVKLLDIGPPVGRPVRFRINGTGIDALRDPARRLAAVMAGDDRLDSIVMDCNEPIRAVRVEIPGDQSRRPGISQSDIGSALATIYEGAAITELRDGQYDGRFQVDIVARGDAASRARPNACPAFSCPLATGGQPCCGRRSGSTGMWSSRWCISATGGPRSPLPSRGARATIVADLSPQIDDLRRPCRRALRSRPAARWKPRATARRSSWRRCRAWRRCG
nr:efflux RND transporter permease subunit [Salipiger aestuarii]